MFICIPLIQHTMLLKMVSSEKILVNPFCFRDHFLHSNPHPLHPHLLRHWIQKFQGSIKLRRAAIQRLVTFQSEN